MAPVFARAYGPNQFDNGYRSQAQIDQNDVRPIDCDLAQRLVGTRYGHHFEPPETQRPSILLGSEVVVFNQKHFQAVARSHAHFHTDREAASVQRCTERTTGLSRGEPGLDEVTLARSGHQHGSLADVYFSAAVGDRPVSSKVIQGNRYRMTRTADHLCQRVVGDSQRALSCFVRYQQQPSGQSLPM
jgi:hypothetical protein